jgi:hypothetical protein
MVLDPFHLKIANWLMGALFNRVMDVRLKFRHLLTLFQPEVNAPPKDVIQDGGILINVGVYVHRIHANTVTVRPDP